MHSWKPESYGMFNRLFYLKVLMSLSTHRCRTCVRDWLSWTKLGVERRVIMWMQCTNREYDYWRVCRDWRREGSVEEIWFRFTKFLTISDDINVTHVFQTNCKNKIDTDRPDIVIVNCSNVQGHDDVQSHHCPCWPPTPRSRYSSTKPQTTQRTSWKLLIPHTWRDTFRRSFFPSAIPPALPSLPVPSPLTPLMPSGAVLRAWWAHRHLYNSVGEPPPSVKKKKKIKHTRPHHHISPVLLLFFQPAFSTLVDFSLNCCLGFPQYNEEAFQ